MKDFILGVVLTLLFYGWLQPAPAQAVYSIELRAAEALERVVGMIDSQTRAEWAQVYWLKRQALSLEMYSECGESE